MADLQLNKTFATGDFQNTKELHLSKGDVFLYEGDAGKKSCYLILSGSVDVRLISGSGHETLLYQLGEGSLVGELAMFDKKVRTATVVATTPVHMIEIEAEEFQQNMGSLAFVEKLAAHFLRRYLMTHDVVCRLSQPNIGMKLCHYFKTLAEQTDKLEEGAQIAIHLPSHASMGKLLSCQRESVTRELKKLTEVGILKQVKGSDFVLDITNVNLYLGDILD